MVSSSSSTVVKVITPMVLDVVIKDLYSSLTLSLENSKSLDFELFDNEFDIDKSLFINMDQFISGIVFNKDLSLSL